MEIVGTIATVMSCLCAKTCLHGSFAEQCTYFKNSKAELENLKSKMKDLKAKRDDIKMELDRAKEQEGKDPKMEVQRWLEKFEEVTEDVDNISEKFQVKKRCLNGFFPNHCARIKSGKNIVKKINEVTELLEKVFPDGLVVNLSPDSGMMLPTTTLVGKTTAERNLEIIWDYLMDDQVKKIGVYGMGGVGKTTIMTHINNRLLKETGRFDKTIWVTVSKESNVEKLQNDIAEGLKLDLSNDVDVMRRAGKLNAELKKRRFVLILDDMWEAFPLENVGIPEPTQENGCKLVITTRSFDVCRLMGCQKKFKLEVLTAEEAWHLFMDKVGNDVTFTPEVELIAKDVCKECAGLPLAIITVGGAMREVNDISEWRKALRDLEGSVTAGVMGMDDNVFKKLKFSYLRLKEEKLQKCFLWCALYPEDYQIELEELIGYWIAEGLIDNGSRQADFDEGQVILNKLINACLLEKCLKWPPLLHDLSRTDAVKMHDLIRDMGLDITSENTRCMIKAGVGLQQLPNEEEWISDIEWVSLIDNKIEILSCKPKCPKLSVLLLRDNLSLREVTGSFFEQMHALRVLNLSNTGIEFLPESLSYLENLRALILRSCRKLRKVPSLAKLKALRELDLSGTSIEEVPQGIEILVKLKRIDFSMIVQNYERRLFPVRVLPYLTSLQDIRVIRSGWEFGRMEELLSLTKLEILRVEFCSFSVYNSYVRSWQMRKLQDFYLSVGRSSGLYMREKKKVELVEFEVEGEDAPLVIPDNTQSLEIHNCHDVSRLSQLCFLMNGRELQQILINRCKGLECILSAEEEDNEAKDEEEGTFLPCVEYLRLWDLNNIRSIYKGIVPRGSLFNLKSLYIANCNKLKNLFSHGMLQHNNLQNLQYINVQRCSEVEEIIGTTREEEVLGEGNDHSTIITLPKLFSLDLLHLPKLKSIYRGVLFSDSLQSIDVWNCPELKRLFIVLVENEKTPPQLSTPALKQIRGSERWWDSVERDYPDAKTLLQPFFTTI